MVDAARRVDVVPVVAGEYGLKRRRCYLSHIDIGGGDTGRAFPPKTIFANAADGADYPMLISNALSVAGHMMYPNPCRKPVELDQETHPGKPHASFSPQLGTLFVSLLLLLRLGLIEG
ncbi:hypothetical protein L2E82_28360 [Cichorium intybus]|uniref:Uncharacterized protein n=1 Tax=Cichorium intybus TaxID=13427 RepID=A0ACB9CVQ9_CICIN|nr:hypothetical protein L2E82_28360 [Cichorium intybus]